MGITTTAAIVGGAALAGGAMAASGGSKKSSTQTATTAPWGPQQWYLENGFEQSRDAHTRAQAVPDYKGNFFAPQNGTQTDAYQRLLGMSGGSLDAMGNTMMTQGMQGVGQYGTALGNAGNLYARSNQDPTQATIAGAGAYANNPYTDGVVDASLRDVDRNLTQGILANNSSAVATGNMNSTRAGVTEGLMQRDARDRAADIAAGVRNSNYQNGLTLSAAQQQQMISNGLTANNQFGQMVTQGSDMASNGANGMVNAGQLALGVGDLQQQGQQTDIDNAMQRYNYDTTNEMNLIQQYMSLVGGNYGSSTTATTTTPQGSSLQRFLGGAMSGAGMASGMTGAGGIFSGIGGGGNVLSKGSAISGGLPK